jgi:hypothetical protein
MMPMQRRRKARQVEKVENLCRTATAQQIFPTRRYASDHACAIPREGPTADPALAATDTVASDGMRKIRWRECDGMDAKTRKASLPEISHFITEF